MADRLSGVVPHERASRTEGLSGSAHQPGLYVSRPVRRTAERSRGVVARWLMTAGRSCTGTGSECDWSISVVPGDEVRRPEPKHLKPQVVVLVGLADPFHAQPPSELLRTLVSRPHYGEQLVC
jgi:hypothetical protein